MECKKQVALDKMYATLPALKKCRANAQLLYAEPVLNSLCELIKDLQNKLR